MASAAVTPSAVMTYSVGLSPTAALTVPTVRLPTGISPALVR